jgi:hypothetical protein
MNDEIIFLVEESPEGGYEAKALGFSIFTEAESLPKLKMNIHEAVKCHFEENEYPHYIRLWRGKNRSPRDIQPNTEESGENRI